MNHADHVRLIEKGIPAAGGRWADMGSGDGAFTLALRDVAGPDVEIVAVDTNQGALRHLTDRITGIFPGTHLYIVSRDMTGQLELSGLDGIIAANSLHYVEQRRHSSVLRSWRSLLKPDGRLIVVEYDSDEGNRWVPFPFSFQSLGRLATVAGYQPPVLLGTHPSHFLDGIYTALLFPRPKAPDLDE